MWTETPDGVELDEGPLTVRVYGLIYATCLVALAADASLVYLLYPRDGETREQFGERALATGRKIRDGSGLIFDLLQDFLGVENG